MSSDKDFYQILGVMPDAEAVVITAAYRALASLYHPDRWKGDKTFATNKMADINVAYDTLSNPVKRAEYNKNRTNSYSSFSDDSEETDTAFDTALSELEKRWQVASEIFPDLIKIRARLSKTSHKLAFSFVILILETKKFDDRNLLANELERRFLETHFGTNKWIIFFAQYLISKGLKKAIVSLNQYVDVLGSSINPQLIIEKISDEHKVNYFKLQQVDGEPLRNLQQSLLKHKHLDIALDLITASGFIAIDSGSIFALNTKFEIFMKEPTSGEHLSIAVNLSGEELIDWCRKNLC
jgi:curved DNA-binding protein CbpA